MPELCKFVVTFHSRFRVGAAYGLDGVDLAVDRRDPLPADHIKGVMRASAEHLAAAGFVPSTLIGEVFGTVSAPCPWTWFGAQADESGLTVEIRNRVRIDPDTHAGAKDMLVSGAQAWAVTATFEVQRLDVVTQVEQHLAVLRLAARHTHHLGSWRRRGLGWVTILPVPDTPSAADDLDFLARASVGGRT